MNRWISRVRRPLRRERGEMYLLLTLLSFAASVAATRLFLELAGYPQLGNSTLHIAHVLWGGLFLFAAALLPLIFSNRWVYGTSAILAGIGVGLFIDEVGKFITQSNDYFYPGAAPIVYAFFLLTVLLYLRVRKPSQREPRSELYQALDSFQEILDHDLDSSEKDRLEENLHYVIQHGEHPDLVHLAEHLQSFLRSDLLHVAPELPSSLERMQAWALRFEARWLGRKRQRAILSGIGFALGVLATINFLRLAFGTREPEHLELWLADLIQFSPIEDLRGFLWFMTRVSLEGSVGFLLLTGSVFLVLGRDEWGVTLLYYSLLLSLTVTNLLVFYFDQFSTILPASVQFLLLLGLSHYRKRAMSEEGAWVNTA